VAFNDLLTGEGVGAAWLLEVVNASGTVLYRWATGSVIYGGNAYEGRICDLGTLERSFSTDNLPGASSLELVLDNTDSGVDFMVNRTTTATVVFQYRFRLYLALWDATAAYSDHPTLTRRQMGEYVPLNFPRRSTNGKLTVSLVDNTLGPVADLGCGPGHVTRFLADQGVVAVGLDLSPGMIAEARRLNPDLEFLEGDMRALPWPDATLGGLAALYSILHLRRPQLPAAFREMRRVLKPGGLALIAFHVGDEDLHLDEWWDMPVRLDFRFFSVAEITPLLGDAGLELVESREREPYEGVEHPSRRAYLMARRAG
jgi:SAM-dependent methyltransferase